MVITITSPGYKYTSELTKTASETTKTRASEIADQGPSLQQFQHILSEKMAGSQQASAASANTTAGSAASSTSTGSQTAQASSAATSTPVDTGLGFKVPYSLKSIFEKAADKYGVDVKLLETIGYIESGFHNTSTSGAGAQGIMQLMPATAKSYGVTDPYDPEQNIMGGAHVLADKLKEFNGNVDLACAAYNCGSGAIHRAGDTLTAAGKRYVEKVHRYYN
ncbi:MAG: transglycosylase SLT domain-containing protein [Lachnospiraceae bacterium]|nr:transglycosylase SLT domain-containing protein [Lachnospiraceae bacterium]